MKQRTKVILIGICLILCCTMFKKKDKKDLSELALVNVEALAENEGISRYFCIGIGTVDCHGHKVEFMIDNYSLK
ncbi:NVEALA domain-containing protein [Parabacteroides sp. OttesenSCG-928-J18]|nr:NVEALA domain-containing protein [Parabacteroides sp. OttesenSCG-928-J18]